MDVKMKKLIDKHEVITFDIFDTLIKRNCTSVKDVWKIVEVLYFEQENKKIDFVNTRYNAEIKCYDNNITPTIEEIYQNIDMDIKTKEVLKKLECQVEYKICVANKKLFEVYEYCKKNNKRIYAISDMYFSNDFLEKILKNNGYDVEKIWVSCENKCNKSSGELFEVFLQEVGCNRKNVLHFGDNKNADIRGSEKAGIDNCLIKKDINNLTYTRKKIRYGEIEERFLYSFMSNRVEFCDNRIEQIGYETLGPLVVGFCQWLQRIKKEKNIDIFMFCARDVKQTMDVYKDMYPDDEVRYLCVSLKSLEAPYKYAIKEDESVYAKEQYDNIRLYLKNLGCKGKVAMVDSGCGGHTQNMISTILGDMCEFHGFYMRISKNFYRNVNDMESLPYMFRERASAKSYISGGFFETMLSATHGRTLAYKKSDLGVEPVFGEANPQMEKLHMFQQGIWKFYEDWKKYAPRNFIISPESIQESFLNFSFYPTREDVELLCQITGGNEAYGEIVNEHSSNFFKNLKDTYWKGGYLCKKLRRYKLICRCYVFIDTIFLNIIGF